MTEIPLGGIYFASLNRLPAFHTITLVNTCTTICSYPEKNEKNIEWELTVVDNSGNLFQQVWLRDFI